jgi:hypothetical protein
MKKRIILLSLALVVGQASHAFAQGATDALRYSRLQFGGPARTLGIGGANVALGADFGNLTSNPAGLGMYQKSEVHFTPGIGVGRSEARIEDNTLGSQSEDKNSLHVASGGLVFTTRRPDSDESTNWRAGSFGIGFTRLADFNTASRYTGQLNDRTVNGRIISGDNQSYLASLRGLGSQGYFDDLRAQGNSGDYTSEDGLAYGAYLTSIFKTRRPGATGQDSVGSRVRRGPIGQSEFISSKGSMSQFDLGYGASYRDRLYLGIGIGIVTSNFTRVREFTETETDPTTHLASYTLYDQLKTTGSGLNARLGAIYRATDALRVGASIQTPTFMRLSDTFNSSITTTFSAQGTDIVSTSLPAGPIGTTTVDALPNDYAYTLTTPFRANGGVAYTLSKHGFVTGDVEYVGYGQARLHNDSQDPNGDTRSFSAENSDIQARYKDAVNVRLGAEGRFDVFRVRLGYARYGDPYKADTNGERAQNFFTGGLGLRQGNFFLDAAAVYTSFDQTYTPYTLGNGLQPVVKVDNNRFTTSLTAGITF